MGETCQPIDDHPHIIESAIQEESTDEIHTNRLPGMAQDGQIVEETGLGLVVPGIWHR